MFNGVENNWVAGKKIKSPVLQALARSLFFLGEKWTRLMLFNWSLTTGPVFITVKPVAECNNIPV